MRRVLLVVGLLVVVAIGLAGWAGWTMRSAAQHLQAARDDLLDARSALTDLDTAAATAAVDAAQSEATAAAGLAQRWVWTAAAAVPLLGDTPDAARSLVLAAESATTAVADLATAADGLSSEQLIVDGQVDLGAVRAAGDAASGAMASLEQAAEHLAAMPSAASGAWVIRPVEEARAELADQVDELTAATETLQRVGDLAPALLGADGPREYFLAVQAPNETRGTGGLVGNWAVVRADAGRISVTDLGSNGDLPDLSALPASLSDDYIARYGQSPRLFPNMNISPDFPSAAALWLASWQQSGGESLDGAIGIDVTAIGDLLAAEGATLTGPDGTSIPGSAFADFALSGIYEKFPTSGDAAARKEYQEVLARQALDLVLSAADPVALARALAEQVTARRVAVWVSDPAEQAELADAGLAQALGSVAPHSVEPVLINIGWSKLDTYIDREYSYRVGRCTDATGTVRSQLTMRVTSNIPAGADLPAYVVGAVPVRADGPVNRVILQAHLPAGAGIQEVAVDGEEQEFWDFVEAGRPAIGQVLELEPRVPAEVVVSFTEPGDTAPGQVLVQPMARGAAVSVTERPC